MTLFRPMAEYLVNFNCPNEQQPQHLSSPEMSETSPETTVVLTTKERQSYSNIENYQYQFLFIPFDRVNPSACEGLKKHFHKA